MVFSLPPEYGYVIITVALQGLQVLILGFAVVGRTRSKVFNEEFMEKNFGAEHQQVTGWSIGKEGYPDMGNGRYSQALPYADWLAFNKAQRTHHNLVEQIASMMIFTLFAGLFFPYPAVGVGFLFILARVLYLGYLKPEGARNKLRSAGAILGDLALLGGFGLSIASGYRMTQESKSS